MMGQPKYIVVDNCGTNSMIIFGAEFQHKEIAASLGRKVISAGFIGMDTDDKGNVTAFAFGESISLDVKSNKEIDTQLAKATLDLQR